MVAKKSQPDVKKRIRKPKRCSHEGCKNGVRKGGVCVTHGAKIKQCSFEGCTNQVVKGGVCYRHLKKYGTCPEIPPTPPYQSINYEDEEELNSWIWKSRSHEKVVVE
jgi:hypothetical protein